MGVIELNYNVTCLQSASNEHIDVPIELGQVTVLSNHPEYAFATSVSHVGLKRWFVVYDEVFDQRWFIQTQVWKHD